MREVRRRQYEEEKRLTAPLKQSRRLSGLTKIVAKPNMTHEAARTIVEFYLKAKGRNILENNNVLFGKAFVEEHKINKRYQGHSYDIWTDQEIIEIDDLGRHSKTSQKINDGIATEFATNHLSQWKFYRLLKEELVDRRGVMQPTAAAYLKAHLF